MIDEAKMRRLAMIQYMYMLAVDQSQQPEPLNMVSISNFHDSVEHFLVLASEYLNAGKTGENMMGYWAAINQKLPSRDLGQRDSMERLNKARVNWKHYGILLPTVEIDDFKTNVGNFFRENTPKVFGLAFELISMSALVQNEEVRDRLLKSEQLNSTGEVKAALEEISIAFLALMGHFDASLWDQNKFLSREISSHRFSRIKNEAPKDLSRFAEEIEKEIAALHEQVRLLSLGIDYRRYMRFQWLTPIVYYTAAGTYEKAGERYGQSHQDYLFCYHFVIECALRLQEIQFA